jgi:hypothetical protein
MRSFHSPESDEEQVREPCKYCDKLISKKFLPRHLKQVHQGSDDLEITPELTKEYCPVCLKLIDCCYLHTHITAKHADQAGSLKVISYRRVSCPVCKMEFSAKAIKRHLIETHKKRIKRPVPKTELACCSECNARVSFKGMGRHRQRMHPKLKLSFVVKQETCDFERIILSTEESSVKPQITRSSPAKPVGAVSETCSPAKPVRASYESCSPANPMRAVSESCSPAKPMRAVTVSCSPAKPVRDSYETCSPAKPMRASSETCSPAKPRSSGPLSDVLKDDREESWYGEDNSLSSLSESESDARLNEQLALALRPDFR